MTSYIMKIKQYRSGPIGWAKMAWEYMARRGWLGLIEYHKWRIDNTSLFTVFSGPFKITVDDGLGKKTICDTRKQYD